VIEMRNNEPIKLIVVATDGSEGARLAAEEGVELAAALQAEVIFLAVTGPPPAVLGDPYYQRRLATELSDARSALAEAVEIAERNGVPCESEHIEGAAPEKIVAFARAQDADLIVVGSRGRGPVKGAFLGSVSFAVARRADRPVLIVHDRLRGRTESALDREAAVV
jgi:nucleotide-binding universal stress UspA family protein